jgi:hypothetical protein
MFFASTPETYRYVLCGGATAEQVRHGVAPYRGYWQPEDLDKTNFEIFQFFSQNLKGLAIFWCLI